MSKIPDPNARPLAKLALEDGTVVTGRAVGARGETGGELCFNTSMSGYQEILTDPSYDGQVMMMTYPHIGNYGCFDAAAEADRPMVAGLVVRAFTEVPSNADAEESLDAYMRRHGLVGITGVDTRRLVRHIRERGVMNAVISSEDLDDASLVAKARALPSMAGLAGHRRLRLRRQAEHPPLVPQPRLHRARVPGRGAAGGRPRLAARRPLLLERPRRPPRHARGRRDGEGGDRDGPPDLRHLPRP